MKELICSPKIYKSSIGSLEKFKRMNRHAGSKPRFGFVVHLASGTTAMVNKRKDRHGQWCFEGVPRHSRQSVQW